MKLLARRWNFGRHAIVVNDLKCLIVGFGRNFSHTHFSTSTPYQVRSRGKKRAMGQHDVPEPFRMALLKSLDLCEVRVEELQRHMAEGKISSVDYVTYCLERIRKVSHFSPGVDMGSRQES